MAGKRSIEQKNEVIINNHIQNINIPEECFKGLIEEVNTMHAQLAVMAQLIHQLKEKIQ